LGFFKAGNYGKYNLKNITISDEQSLKDKKIIFLGSSVTYGYGSMGVSFVDFLEKSCSIIAIKEAVSGTTLVDVKGNSYISRMKKINTSLDIDAFVCQLSTNDATKNMPLGDISESNNKDDFDTKTIAGAIEYIIAYAKDIWNCPVVFYTQPKYESEKYADMVKLLLKIKSKWNIEVVDFWNDEQINSISEQERKLYLVDKIHPTKAGYCQWFLPKFQKQLAELFK
ncbi:MAG: SGNH/GDSL hydrolase family protein, partial [Clostridiales bacterium]|nr:SGNH/GDSL hydrolase family protein [Clostridiales bacterium]